jgi:hypothetical protein
MRVYSTCKPEAAPTEYTAAATGAAEGMSKLAWMPEQDNLIVVAKRTGQMQLWDVRAPAENGAVNSVLIPGGGVIMDLELNPAHGSILLASERRVRSAMKINSGIGTT